MMIEPVFLPASRRTWKPGYICSHDPLTVCTGFVIADNRVKYSTLTYQKGCPAPLDLSEACFREFIGEENLKRLYRYARTLEAQRKVLGAVTVHGWCRWDFVGNEPLPIIEETDKEYRILFHPCCDSVLNGNIAAVLKDDVEIVPLEEAWRYWWVGSDVNRAIQKESLPEGIREDLVRGMY